MLKPLAKHARNMLNAPMMSSVGTGSVDPREMGDNHVGAYASHWTHSRNISLVSFSIKEISRTVGVSV